MITYSSTTLTSYNTITRIEVYYYKSVSATDLAGGSWSTAKPTWENGKYIWQKIRTTYEGKLENGLYYSESNPVNITGQQGATGISAYSYKLNASDSVIGKTKNGEYTINKITFTATCKQGTEAVTAYEGRFKIETTNNGTTWTTVYPASGTGVDESSKEFTIPEDIISLRCSLYQAGDMDTLLDIVTIPVIKDGIDAVGLVNSIPFYLASDQETGITVTTPGWTRYKPELSSTNKYLWVFYVSRYGEGVTSPQLIEDSGQEVVFDYYGEISPLENVTVDINPVQSGSGTPSSSNIRHITGWTSVSIGEIDISIAQYENNRYNLSFSNDKAFIDNGILNLTGSVFSINGSTLNIADSTEGFQIVFPESIGTVYGGTLDITNGILTVTHGYIDSYNNETLPSTWISDRDVYSSGRKPTVGAQVVYELSQPLVYNITPREVMAYTGVNHLKADSGNIYISYYDNQTATEPRIDYSLTSAFENSAEALDKINNLEIGGRNLLKKSGDFTDTIAWGVDNGTRSDDTVIFTFDSNTTGSIQLYQLPSNGYWTWQADTNYVMSIDAKADTAGAQMYFYAIGINKMSPKITLTTEWKRYSFVTRGTTASIASASFSIDKTGANTVMFRRPKLEIGNQPTDWTPAPEDIPRGTGFYSITTEPPAYTITIGGYTYSYRIARSTIAEQSGVKEVMVGDVIQYGYNTYPVGYVDSVYAYLGTANSIRGATGASGLNNARVILYRRFASTPTGTDIAPTGDVTYTFSTGIATNNLNSWTQNIPSGTDPVYMIAASASNTGTTDVIPKTEWSAPVKILENGQDGSPGGAGADGYNQATIFLYQRKSGTAPSKPNSAVTYTFSTGALSSTPTGWSRTIPINNGNPCYVTTATAIAKTATYSIPVSGWSDVVVLSQDGENGTSITITSTSVKYQKGTSGTTAPTGTWQTSIPTVDENEYLWTQTIVNYSDNSKTESYSVSRNAKNGTNGTSPTVSSTTVEYQQSTSGTTTPTGSWVATPPIAVADQYMWTRTTVSYSDNKTAISYSVSKNGANGVSVTNVTSTNNTSDGGTSVITVTLSDGTTKTFNIKNGSKGDTGATAQWYYGTALTHTSGTATLPATSTSNAVVGSMYLNVQTSLVYKCTAVGTNNTWTYAGDLTTGVINNIEVGGKNLLLQDPKYFNPSAYNAYQLYLTEPLEAGQTYTIQLWDVDVSNSQKTTQQLGVNVYYCGGSVSFGYWIGEQYFTNGHADYLALTFTPTEANITHSSVTGTTGAKYICLYNSVPYVDDATENLTVGKWQLEKGNIATDWTPAPEDIQSIADAALARSTSVYGTSSTAANTAQKVVNCSNFVLFDGARVQVTFSTANTASAPTLNVNSTGAKAIYINKTVTSSSNLLLWTSGSKMEFVYDGTGWVVQNVPYALYGTCSTVASVAEKSVTCNEAIICKGTVISVNMTYANTSANATMNVGSTLAKDIYANETKLTTNSRFNWRANSVQKFVFDGQVWRMDDDTVKALATAYISETNDDGIMVHPENDTTSGWSIAGAIELFKTGISYIKLWIDNNIPKIRIGKEDSKHVLIDNDSVDIVDDETVLASFGETVQIGKSDVSHAELDSHSFKLIDKQGNTYFHVSDLRNEQGEATLTETFWGDGTTTRFSISLSATSVVSVKINDIDTSAYTKSGVVFIFTTAPADGDEITIVYETIEMQAKAYTFGLRGTENIGALSVAEGNNTNASGFGSHTEGKETTARGRYSHAEGVKTIANGFGSHVEGERTTANESYSHAEGFKTIANESYSHAEGMTTTASGLCSHSEGEDTVAAARSSHAQNVGTIASKFGQTALGTWNEEDPYSSPYGKYAVIIGNGENDNNRSNALAITWDGDTEFALDTTASSGTTDAGLYDAITALGWENDILV